MKGRWLFWTIAANLVALVGLAFAYPQLMLSPGPVVAAHAEIGTDCFACHQPWRGAAAERCIACHALPDIGLRTTQGAAIVPSAAQPRLKVRFHQALVEQNCMACHTDHSSPRLAQQGRKAFSHALLRADVQQRCEGCRQKPTDRLHRQLTGDCQACHRQDAWKPATFDHTQSFVLDRHHQTECATCHKANDKGNSYQTYTCYGCHEHTPANIKAEHEEEGIRDFANCVECHRDPGVEPEKGGAKRGGGKREKD